MPFCRSWTCVGASGVRMATPRDARCAIDDGQSRGGGVDACGDAAVVEPHSVVGDLLEVVLDCEVPRVEADELGVGEVAEVCLATLGREEDVALPPEDEGERLTTAERVLPRRVQGGVRSVVVEQVELNAMCVRASEE